jgi:hypothetical protein
MRERGMGEGERGGEEGGEESYQQGAEADSARVYRNRGAGLKPQMWDRILLGAGGMKGRGGPRWSNGAAWRSCRKDLRHALA